MTIRSRFFSGTYYGQDDFKKMIKDGLSSGYVKGESSELKVTADGKSMVVQVGVGRGYLVGYSFDVMDEPYNLTVIENTELDVRYDRVIAHMDEESGITLIIKQGDNKNPPELVREGKIYEISLAKIKVNRNVGVITQDNITDERGDPSVCGVVGPHVGTLPLASTKQVGGVQIDTSTGLTISNTGVLGYDDKSHIITIDVGDSTAPQTTTVVGVISGGGNTVSDTSQHTSRSGSTVAWDVSISLNQPETATLYSGLALGRIINPSGYNTVKLITVVKDQYSQGGVLLVGRTYNTDDIISDYHVQSKTYTITLPDDWDYNTDRLYVRQTAGTSNECTAHFESYNPGNRTAYWQYPVGTEVPVIPPLLSQTDIDQDDLIARIIEKIGGI